MANLFIILPETGLTLIGKVYNSSGVQQGSDVTMTESSTNVYTGTYDESGLAIGSYDEFTVLFSSSAVVKGDGLLKVENGSEVNDRYLQDIRDDISALNDIDLATIEGSTVLAKEATLATKSSQASVDTIDGIVDSILVDTGTTIPAQISGLNDLSAAQVNAEVDTALADYDAPTKAELDAGLAPLATEANATTNTTSIVSEVNANEAKIDTVVTNTNRVDALIENVTGDRFTAKALETSPTAEMSEAELHSALDSYANKDNWKADVSGLASQLSIDNLNDLSTADIDARLAAYDAPTLAEMTAAFTEIKGAGWTTTDTLEAIRDSITSGAITAADIWSYVTRELTAGTKDTEIDAIKAKTDNLPADPASETTLASLATSTQAEDIKKNTNLIPATL